MSFLFVFHEIIEDKGWQGIHLSDYVVFFLIRKYSRGAVIREIISGKCASLNTQLTFSRLQSKPLGMMFSSRREKANVCHCRKIIENIIGVWITINQCKY